MKTFEFSHTGLEKAKHTLVLTASIGTILLVLTAMGVATCTYAFVPDVGLASKVAFSTIKILSI